ncbi:hypothetical protein W02_08940 [Nitrospira sp. KM1]|nr:hypothetical protein W02_08940 [Nitrospira sp. KM1]
MLKKSSGCVLASLRDSTDGPGKSGLGRAGRVRPGKTTVPTVGGRAGEDSSLLNIL